MKTLEMNYKIKDLTPELSKQIQKICFDMGIENVRRFYEAVDKIPGVYIFSDNVSHRFTLDGRMLSTQYCTPTEITPQAFIEKYGKKELIDFPSEIVNAVKESPVFEPEDNNCIKFNQSKMKWNKDNLKVGDVLAGEHAMIVVEFVMPNSIQAIYKEGKERACSYSFKELKQYNYTKVEPKKEWYDDIKEGGVWCLCWDEDSTHKIVAKVTEYLDEFCPFATEEETFEYAIPLTEEEIEKFGLNK